MTPTEQRPSECKHLDEWWLCKKSKEDQGFQECCDYYPQCSDCPHYEPKEKTDEEQTKTN